MKTLYTLLAIFLIPMSVFAAAPNNVTGEVKAQVQSGAIQVSWSASTNFDGTPVAKYRVYIDTHTVPDAETYAEHQDTSTADTTLAITQFKSAALQDGVSYYFSVTALNAAGEESTNYSQEVSVKYTVGATTSGTKTKSTGDASSAPAISTNAPIADVKNFLQVVSAVAGSKNTVIVAFNKTAVLPTQSPETAFSIQAETGETLAVKAVTLADDKMQAHLQTEDQTDLKKYTVTVLSAVTDEQGNPIVSGVMDQAIFLGTAKVLEATTNTEILHGSAVEKDTTPPEDVTNLKASYKLNAAQNAYDVLIKWIGSADSAKDLDHQNFQQKVEDKDYTEAIRIEKDKTSYDKVLAGGKRYTFKISTIDATGNESTGAITSIVLPETGPAALLAIITMLSAGAAYVIQRKKA